MSRSVSLGEGSNCTDSGSGYAIWPYRMVLMCRTSNASAILIRIVLFTCFYIHAELLRDWGVGSLLILLTQQLKKMTEQNLS